MGLKSELNEFIKQAKRVSYFDALEETHRIGVRLNNRFKPSNMERRLRPSESPQIKTIYDDKGHIVAYEWIENDVLTNSEMSV